MKTTYKQYNSDIIIKLTMYPTPIKPLTNVELAGTDYPNIEQLQILNNIHALLQDLNPDPTQFVFNSPYGILNSSVFRPLTSKESTLLGPYTGILPLSEGHALLLNGHYLTDAERISFSDIPAVIN